MARPPESPDDDALGMQQDITRKDFLNTTLLGVGAALLGAAPPAALLAQAAQAKGQTAPDLFTGYGGVGDYAKANGNTLPVLTAAHKIRDGLYAKMPPVHDTGELFDVVIVGGGISGLSAAYTFQKGAGKGKRVLILENHPIFGGEARQNEFRVGGYRLIGPQGSNQGSIPRAGSPGLTNELWTELGLPREVSYQEWDARLAPLRFQTDNYAHMEGVDESLVDVGYYFDERSGASRPTWLRNIWQNDLADTPFSADVKADLLKWRNATGENTEAFRRKLDGMTYKQYLEGELGLRPEATKMAEPVVGLINGASPDAVSAFAASQIGMPGVVPRVRGRRPGGPLPISFPGGNAAYARGFVRTLIPDALPSGSSMEGLFGGKVDFTALDRAGAPTRIRLGSTVIRVRHVAQAGSPDLVEIVYERGGRVSRVRARRVIMASGGWITKHVVADLPATIKAAYDEFAYAPALVVNVALTNWRFLYKLGAPACRWFGPGFGFSCNIRRPMVAGAYQPPFHPDKPTVLTFYTGLYTPGHTAAEQGVLGRTKLFETPYATYERTIRQQMTRMFGSAGFNPRTDIAGIILNRWGHARVLQAPGFYYGRDGKPAARTVVEAGFGNVAIGHSELNGHQSATGAMAQGKRAAEQILASAS